jgi:hypothetical protein
MAPTDTGRCVSAKLHRPDSFTLEFIRAVRRASPQRYYRF